VPDMVIADRLRERSPGIDPRFVSYATGAATLAEGGYTVIDLKLKEDTPYLEMIVEASRLIAQERPDLVVSHEEFAALPAAKAFGVPTLFIVDFFMAADHVWMQSLQYADEIVFIERRGIFPEPPHAQGRVTYAGPIVRPLSWSRADRGRARDDLRLPPAAKVMCVIPGAWATEERAPILHLVMPAFASLARIEKRLIWVAGRDYDFLSEKLRPAKDVIVVKEFSPIEKVMVACDLAITKANRGTTIELANLGVPSIALSHALNPIDEAVISRIRSSTALNAKAVDGAFLSQVIEEILSAGTQEAERAVIGGGEHTAAERIAKFVSALA